jgi:hypothetical protein
VHRARAHRDRQGADRGGGGAENKLDAKSQLHVINEVADLYSCNNCIFFETRKRRDLFLWFSKTPQGPSMKCLVQNGTQSACPHTHARKREREKD